MSKIELDLGGGFKLTHFLKKGYTGYFEGHTFRIIQGDTAVESFSDSQGKILSQLMLKKAMTPKQISDVVGWTPAAVIYNLKPLIEAGAVERHPLPGGTVFYVLCWDVRMDISPGLKARIESDVVRLGGWEALGGIPMRTLRRELAKLSEDEFLEVMRYLVEGNASAN
jgi:hypothetical protein